MQFCVIPKSTLTVLLDASAARTWLSQIDSFDSAHTIRIGAGEAVIVGRIDKLDENVAIITLWTPSMPDVADIKDEPILSIWVDPDASTIWSLEFEDRCLVLDRVCQLASRLWLHQGTPPSWREHKADNYPTIFAGGSGRLEGIRLAFRHASVAQREAIHIGSIYYHRRKSKTIRVPALQEPAVEMFPLSITKPSPDELPAIIDINAAATVPDDRDLVISTHSGQTRHIFSMSYPDWVGPRGPLTRQQRKVIAHQMTRPLRIHGPAGSGKTLVLILKALRLLREAQEAGKACHILIVANSTAMRGTIRAAIEAIDDLDFMATSKTDSQFLDVETLHGWCIRELGLDAGPRYVLEDDPTISRNQQMEILSEVLDQALTTRLAASSSLISSDFEARCRGNRAILLRDFAWEIAIRIKGRGFRKDDGRKYTEAKLPSFIGRGENRWDRQFIFYVYQLYEAHFERLGLLDTDDVTLSMSARLTTSLWDRQRRTLGYDYVMVDETHLFNENERRVLPYLTRGTEGYIPIVMTFDESQSIGGQRMATLDVVGIENSERKTLNYVHRSSPDILALARDLVERSPLLFTEFENIEPVASMDEGSLKRCIKPTVIYAYGPDEVIASALKTAGNLRLHNYPRVAIICFTSGLLSDLMSTATAAGISYQHVRERGEPTAASHPGLFVTSPDASGGLEFDVSIILGVDAGVVPVSIDDLSPEGYMSVEEEAFKELYTSITRARYRVIFVSDAAKGISPLLRVSIANGLLVEYRAR